MSRDTGLGPWLSLSKVTVVEPESETGLESQRKVFPKTNVSASTTR